MGRQGAGRGIRGAYGIREVRSVNGAAGVPGPAGPVGVPGRRGRGSRPGVRGLRAAVTATAVVLGVTGMLAGTAPAAYADPGPTVSETRLEEVRTQLENLYRAAEKATEAYNAAKEQVDLQQKEIVKLARNIETTQRRMDELKRQAGALASAQYRGGGIPPEARLMLNKDPERFLDDATLVRKSQHAANDLIAQLGRTKNALEGYSQDATDRWERLEENRRKKEAAQLDIRKKVEAAQQLESRLAAEEKERLRKLEDARALLEQQKWLDSGVLKDINAHASEAGKKAVAFATAQIGKDYVWGAEGPDTFDCSGLTMRAWEAAGKAVPRTSQEQWRQLPRIDIKDMRPGDLIIYYGDASHVGMYVGDGAIVHAPRPGRQVTLAGAGSMPILGVVRPDK
ncbi:putative endopeptidase precursor [Streptomyces rimosus subsp. rimosus]|nr:putative endopeptidase precursor [Streptomyces rimosus subsp. rimosus]UTH95324.1 putative endopeptidase precursor [Streptomyces rimosus subsp. rimosus]UTJ13421.1 putative endopeptidase precursor [Streptomyces rimosus subsp. rimosus]